MDGPGREPQGGWDTKRGAKRNGGKNARGSSARDPERDSGKNAGKDVKRGGRIDAGRDAAMPRTPTYQG